MESDEDSVLSELLSSDSEESLIGDDLDTSYKLSTTTNLLLHGLEDACLRNISLRRDNNILKNLWKAKQSTRPCHLNCYDLPIVAQRTAYQTRNASVLQIPKTRTEQLRGSFVPRAIALWNSQPPLVQQCASILDLKRHLSKDPVIDTFRFVEYSRQSSIDHVRLRTGNHNLNHHLNSILLSETKACECGYQYETAQHYLEDCMSYDVLRAELSQRLLPLSWTVSTLLLGFNDGMDHVNVNIALLCQEYMERGQRFRRVADE